jgi:NAD(P)-dependent dehydrogenase (short-subunit alcohol dehydrogenase family)
MRPRPVRGPLEVDTALVTGAGHGIGRAIALELGSRGVAVACVSRTDSSEQTATEIQAAGGSATAFALDLADFRRVEQVLGRWVSRVRPGRCAAILAAAVLGPQSAGARFDVVAWEGTFRVNVLGNLAAVNVLLPVMLDSGFGRVVFFSGGGAALPFPTFPAYAASKVAIARVVEHLHQELAPHGDLAVVSLAPGSNPTRTLAAVRAAGGSVRTLCDISESVDFVVRFLSSDDARRLSGRLVHVRDDWSRLAMLEADDLRHYWMLRRVE